MGKAKVYDYQVFPLNGGKLIIKMLKIGSNLYPRSEPIFFQYQARCDFNVSGFYFNSYCFILNLINS